MDDSARQTLASSSLDALLAAIAGFLAMLPLRRWRALAFEWRAAIAGAIVAGGAYLISKTHLADFVATRHWLVSVLWPAAMTAWVILFVGAWASIQKSLGALGSDVSTRLNNNQVTDLAQRIARDELLQNRDSMRRDVVDLLDEPKRKAQDAATLSESLRDELTQHRGWVDSRIETARVSLNSELALRAREEASEVRRMVEDLRGPNQTIDPITHTQVTVERNYPNISELNRAIEEHRKDIWGIKTYLAPLPEPSPDDPNWNEYLEHREYIPLWQALALAFGYEPSKLRRGDTGEADIRSNYAPNTNQFKVWMERAISSLGGELPCQSVDGINSRVTLYDFSKWMMAKYFPGLPEKLRLLAQIQPARA
jgi:hypothetical protein